MNNVSRFLYAALSVGLLALPFMLLRANLTSPENVNVVDKALLEAIAPAQDFAGWVADFVSESIQEYTYLVDVGRDNERLRRENDLLREEARGLRIHARENQRLRSLLELRERLPGETISAEIISKEHTRAFRVNRIRLDRGQRDRVRPGMPVISSQGLVGQVRRLFGRYADVLLAVDRSSAIDVLVQRTGARGVLKGTGDSNRYLCTIEYLQRSEQVEVGDEVYTSGLGLRFPSSLLVGRVTRVVREEFGLYQEVEVTPAVNFATLEEVLILTTGSRRQRVGVDENDEALP